MDLDHLEPYFAPLTDFSLVDVAINAFIGKMDYNPSYRNDRGLARSAISGLLLGIILTSALFLIPIFPSLWQILLVAALSCIYHLLEFLTTTRNHPETASYDSFLFYQSFEYAFARVMYHLEFFLWYFLWPDLRTNKFSTTLSCIGLIGVLTGQAIRTIAMYQCGASFTHVVMQQKKQEHVLITHGIYQYFRHPSYFGWFLWATSLQLLMFNPLFFVATCYMSYRFFSERIPREERALVEFFGQEYVKYRDATPTWLPFIR